LSSRSFKLKILNSRTFLFCWVSCIFVGSLGCNRSNPYLTTQQLGGGVSPPLSQGIFSGLLGNPPLATNQAVAPQQQALAAREADLNRRLQLLDENNRQLQTQLAQSQQQSQLANDERALLRRQLQDVTGQLQQTQIASLQTKDQLAGMSEQVRNVQASNQLRGGARLTANNSLVSQTDHLRDLGFPVIQDTNVVRIRVPADQLFQPNTATLTPSASEILDRVATTLRGNFSRQRVGIEGHTDAGPFYGGTYSTAQQLASAQSNAVVEHLQRRNQVPASQLFSLAHGTNHPIADNQSPTNRALNRRIEVVIYPDTY
jgi:flagellar motor protein MotB